MKKIVLALIGLAAGFYGYRWFDGHQAYKAYEGFAEGWAQEKRTAAGTYGDEPTTRHAFEERSVRGNRAGAIMEAFRGTRYRVESQERNAAGDYELVVVQTIFFDPPGVTTAIGGAMFARFRETAGVHRTGGGWRVVAFEPTFMDMGETRKR